MPDPRWTGPPEVIAAILEAGSPASVIANNLVWVTETASHEMAMGLSFVNTAATLNSWQGLGAIASAVAATGLNTGLQTMAGWTAHKIMVTQAAIDAFTTAQSAVIPSVVAQTNRDEWTVLNATNILGQNTPAIVERDTEYFGEYWPQNSGIGWTYSGALSALSAALAVPPPIAPMGASPAAPAAAGEAVAQAAAQTGMSDAMQASSQAAQTTGQAASSSSGDAAGQLSSLMQQPLQMMSSATEPLKEVLQAPTQAVQGFSSLPQSLMQSFGGMFPSSSAAPEAAAAEAVAEPAVAGGVTAGGLGAGSAGAAGGAGVGAFPGAGLTSYTRPTSSFEPETAGRPTGLPAGVLNAADVRGPTTSAGMGGTPMPMSPAGMLARADGDSDKDKVPHARIVVSGDQTEPR